MTKSNTTPSNELVEIDDQFLPPESQEHINDLEYARANVMGAMEKAEKGMQELSTVAECSQLPRSYEVLGNYLKIIGELSKDFVQISKDKRQAKEMGPVEKDGKVVNNLFVGSTKELAEMLKAKKQ